MTQLWMDGFDHYGLSAAAMLDGAWGVVDSGNAPVIPSFGARTGTTCLELGTAVVGDIARRVNGSGVTELIVGMGFYIPELPSSSNRVSVMCFVDTNGDSVVSLFVGTDGTLTARGPTASNNYNTGSLLGVSDSPIITAGTWHHVEVRVLVSATVGEVEVRVDETAVAGLDLSTQNTGTDSITSMTFGTPESNVPTLSTPQNIYIDDIVVRDTAGSFNNTFQGDLRVATLQPISNGTNQGWAARSIEKLGVGVLRVNDNGDRNSGVRFLDDAALEIGASSYTLEQFVRFERILTTTEEMNIASKYNTDSDNRSWLLQVNGPDDGGDIRFQTSSDGTLGDVETVHSFPFIPVTNRWYHVAVVRDDTDSYLFLDGQQIGITETDSRTYFDGNASLAISGRMSSTLVIIDNSALEGWIDGFRLTIGVARYTANFVPPTAALPTDVSGDSDYNSVALLMNFDNDAVTDQSSNAFTGSLRNSAVQDIPDDSAAYQTIDGTTPNDFDFIEAALVAATGTLTLTGQPLDTETVTLGSFTYTFETAFTDTAFFVLIGAAFADSIDNLIAAITLGAGSGTLYGATTTLNTDATASNPVDEQMLATASTAGTTGNTLASTETLTNGSWNAALLSGGENIPSNSEFNLSALPSEVTGVRAVAIVNRAFKTDSGSATLQTSFVETGGASEQGTDRSITTDETYYEDTFETDPVDGVSPITPSTLVGARIRINRTT